MSAPPTKVVRVFDFNDFSENYPTVQQPGLQLDAEFNAAKAASDATIDRLALIQRQDGALFNGVVTLDAMSTQVLTLIGGWLPRGAWVTARVYAVKDTIVQNNQSYLCLIAHTSGVFATDLAAGKWVVISGLSGIAPDGSTTITADIPFNTHKITGLGDGTNPQDAVTKAQLDVVAASTVPDASEVTKGVVYIADQATANSGTNDTEVLTSKKFNDSKYNPIGKHHYPILAASLAPDTSTSGGGPVIVSNVSATNKVPFYSLDYDATTQENAGVSIPGPKSLDETVAITAVIRWTASGGTIAQGVVWGLSITGSGDGDDIDVSYSAAVKVTDALIGTTLKEHITTITANVTVKNWAEGDTLNVLISRFPADAGDTLSVDAKLRSLDLFVTTNAATDA